MLVIFFPEFRNEEIWQATIDLQVEHMITKSFGTTMVDYDLFLEMTVSPFHHYHNNIISVFAISFSNILYILLLTRMVES